MHDESTSRGRTTEHAVVIAGGGPTGMMLAAELALAGVDVAVIERHASRDFAPAACIRAPSRCSISAASPSASSPRGRSCRSRALRSTRSADALTPAGGAAAETPPPSSGLPDANGELLLDELEDADALFTAGAISGEWFTYSDGTSPITPPDHTGIAAVEGEAHISGSGFNDWGAGLSAYFRSVDLTAFDAFRLREGQWKHHRRAPLHSMAGFERRARR